jgi:hypothetical protein
MGMVPVVMFGEMRTRWFWMFSVTTQPPTPDATHPAIAGSGQGVEGDWVIVLRPLKSEVPAVVRVRRALKYLLRTHGLECTHILDRLPASPPMPPTPKQLRKKRPRKPRPPDSLVAFVETIKHQE